RRPRLPRGRRDALDGRTTLGGGRMRRLRRRSLFVMAAALGAAVAVLPAGAGAGTGATLTAGNAGVYHHWTAPSVTVAPGGSVTLSNPTSVSHGVRWVSGPGTPSCAASVPVGETPASAGTEWSGSCTFSSAGTYSYYCTVHGAAMAGTVHVEAPG